ncbi:uncharacterized protein PGTG_21495 [Puccinia graminis f. sp. tritici CRL 75-36-700-3]|uniref:Uncharacterized protein n=1 Tax=Puccinia graminis f. sp. tritici (strain CRL 75-36-700-3 / race SCCL) TaxID=418459 RepID=H6QRK9_PUCGT|nr:uncharacterized protein PGTG_21495 [Puccinia graminis f. sp. tritici CRL 75-36-700-3]EHS63279.1 hypothetical protein PGTG_21495 [Puccinia graminis f. sp. tritici CRL 75-36-700-3]
MDSTLPTDTDPMTEEVLAKKIIRRQQLTASSNTRRFLLLEAAALILDDNNGIDDLIPSHGGSKPGKKPNKPRNFEASYQRLLEHYFSDSPLYDATLFRRRFRMSKPIFLKITEEVKNYDSYFTQKPDALGKMGLHPLVKVTAALRMLAYGAAGDCNDEYLQLSETTSLQCMDRFCNAIVDIYGSQYLRAPTAEDLEQLLTIGA